MLHYVIQSMTNLGFTQCVKSATHDEGGCLDLVFLFTRDSQEKLRIKIHLHFVHYSDHAVVVLEFI